MVNGEVDEDDEEVEVVEEEVEEELEQDTLKNALLVPDSTLCESGSERRFNKVGDGGGVSKRGLGDLEPHEDATDPCELLRELVLADRLDREDGEDNEGEEYEQHKEEDDDDDDDADVEDND